MQTQKGFSQQKYRILRIIEYVGEREWVDEQIAKRGVKGTYHVPNGRGVIREAIIGETAEVVDIDYVGLQVQRETQ